MGAPRLKVPEYSRSASSQAVVYRRVSTDEQKESGAGLEAQIDSCTAYAQRSGLEIAGEFSDEGISGAAPLDKRPGLMNALALVGPGDVLVVAKRDRLGRDPIVVALIEAAVIRQGGRVVSAAGEGTEGDDPTSILMRRIIDAFAEYERLIIKSRTFAALAAKRKRGQRTGSIPMGLMLFDDGARSKTDRPLALVPCPEDLDVVELILELAALGLSLRKIAAELTARGIPGKRGITKRSTGLWSHSSVSKVLKRFK
jgi:DNA invertase Pin-like site-specific DNA recombinase